MNGNISERVNISDGKNNELPWIDRLPFIDLNWTEIKSYSDYCNIHNMMYEEIYFMEEI